MRPAKDRNLFDLILGIDVLSGPLCLRLGIPTGIPSPATGGAVPGSLAFVVLGQPHDQEVVGCAMHTGFVASSRVSACMEHPARDMGVSIPCYWSKAKNGGGPGAEPPLYGRRNGLVLIAVLWMIAVMTAIVAVVGQTSRLNMKMAMAATDEVRCKWACRAGTENAIAVLNEDLRDSDCLSDLWRDNDDDFNDVTMERCRYSVRVIDEAGKLNINTATKDQLMALPYMEEDIAEAIVDWRDGDDDPQSQGAEAGYYENLPVPYKIRNGPFKTVRELLAVKGVTEEYLYGEDTNLNGLLDSNERDGDLSPPSDNGDDYLDQGWIAYLTCYSYEKNVDAEGDKRVNINQADQQQLQDQLGIKVSQAKWIADNRGQGYKSIADLINDRSPRTSSESAGGNQDQAEPIDMQTFGQIADRITISGEDKIPGKINVNTASREVLASLFGRDDQAEQIALAIVADRAGLLYGFTSVADLLNQQSVSVERFKGIADLITVRSDVFTVQCLATADVSGANFQTECVLDRSASPCTILYWYQGANY